jgi:hypothetical protein
MLPSLTRLTLLITLFSPALSDARSNGQRRTRRQPSGQTSTTPRSVSSEPFRDIHRAEVEESDTTRSETAAEPTVRPARRTRTISTREPFRDIHRGAIEDEAVEQRDEAPEPSPAPRPFRPVRSNEPFRDIHRGYGGGFGGGFGGGGYDE